VVSLATKPLLVVSVHENRVMLIHAHSLKVGMMMRVIYDDTTILQDPI
jgi:hypothetical protein